MIGLETRTPAQGRRSLVLVPNTAVPRRSAEPAAVG